MERHQRLHRDRVASATPDPDISWVQMYALRDDSAHYGRNFKTQGEPRVLIGCYSRQANSSGLYELDFVGNEIHIAPRSKSTNHTWFLELGADRLLATVEEEDGAVVLLDHDGAGWSVSQTSSLTTSHPCHIAATGFEAIVAGYSSGGVHIVDLCNASDPRTLLFPQPSQRSRSERQTSAHPHFTGAWRNSWWTSDLGGDAIREVVAGDDWGLSGSAITLPPGTGPRHFDVHHGALFCVGELSSKLHRIQDNHRPAREGDAVRTTADSGPNAPSHVHVTASGAAIVGNRGAGTLGVIDVRADRMTLISELELSGPSPRHFRMNGSQLVVADDVAGHVEILHVGESLEVLRRQVVPVPGAAFIGQKGWPAV